MSASFPAKLWCQLSVLSFPKPQLKIKLPSLSILSINSYPLYADFQVPTSSEYLGVGFCFGLQLIENNNINNVIKDIILALDLTWLDLTWLD